MPNVPKNPESWREALKLINRCPICMGNYATEAAKVFAEEGTAKFVHLVCATCRSYFVAMLVTIGPGISSVGMVTDLSFEDVRRLYGTSPITTDELINGYELMQNTVFLNSLILNR